MCREVILKTEQLEGYIPEEDYKKELPPAVKEETIDCIIEKIRQAKRPVFYAGNGIRISGGYQEFRSVVEKMNIQLLQHGMESMKLRQIILCILEEQAVWEIVLEILRYKTVI